MSTKQLLTLSTYLLNLATILPQIAEGQDLQKSFKMTIIWQYVICRQDHNKTCSKKTNTLEWRWRHKNARELFVQ